MCYQVACCRMFSRVEVCWRSQGQRNACICWWMAVAVSNFERTLRRNIAWPPQGRTSPRAASDHCRTRKVPCRSSVSQNRDDKLHLLPIAFKRGSGVMCTAVSRCLCAIHRTAVNHRKWEIPSGVHFAFPPMCTAYPSSLVLFYW